MFKIRQRTRFLWHHSSSFAKHGTDEGKETKKKHNSFILINYPTREANVIDTNMNISLFKVYLCHQINKLTGSQDLLVFFGMTSFAFHLVH